MMQTVKNPFLDGNFSPWRSEDNFNNLEIIGKIPSDLNGVLLRNGPNPQFDPTGSYHWFEGDGMLHAIRIQDGQASYDNRWIRTERFNLENKAGKCLFNANLSDDDPLAETVKKTTSSNKANTNVIAYQEKILALNESASPTSIQLDNLTTLGEYTFDGQITRRLTAHPKFDYKHQEFITYSYIDMDGQLIYYRLNQQNKLIAEKAINWPYAAMMHDFVNTENYVIFPIFPCTMSFERRMQGESIFMWEGDKLNTFFIITNKEGDEIARIETDPCHVYHFGNAYEIDKNILVIDAMVGKLSGLMPDRYGKIATREDSDARLGRWTINLKNNSIHLAYLDDISTEFPRFDERFNGYPYQHLYAGGRANSRDLFDRIMHYDLINHKKQAHHFGNDVPSEPIFASRSEKEGDGYLLTVVYRTTEDRSDVVILDAQSVADDPIAVIKIPHRIPFGFHGNFINLLA
jgi:carotenoid cleavage dioxygenase-like enzyme